MNSAVAIVLAFLVVQAAAIDIETRFPRHAKAISHVQHAAKQRVSPRPAAMNLEELEMMPPPTHPSVPNNYMATIELNFPDINCTDSFFEARDYDNNRLQLAHNHFDRDIYWYDQDSHFSINFFDCEVYNVTAEELHPHHGPHGPGGNHSHQGRGCSSGGGHHGPGFDPDYDNTTHHLRPSDDLFHIGDGNFTYVGNAYIRGIPCWHYKSNIANHTFTHNNMTFTFTYDADWFFAPFNYGFDDGIPPQFQNHSNTTVPISADINGTRYINGVNNGTFHMIHNWVDFFPFADHHAFEIPEEMYCPMLVNKPMPTLPTSVSYSMEMNDFKHNFTFNARLFYDYNANNLRIDTWENGHEYKNIYLLNDWKHWNVSEGALQCNEETIQAPSFPTHGGHHPHHFNFADSLIDFTNHHLYPLSFSGHDSCFKVLPNWEYAGNKMVRDIDSEVWIAKENVTIPPQCRHFANVSTFFSFIVWHFAPSTWHDAGEGQQATTPMRQDSFFKFFNGTGWDFEMREMNIFDVRFNYVSPAHFAIPMLCKGAPEDNNISGLDSGAATGLSFGMLILGAVLGAGAVCFMMRRKRPGGAVNSEENVTLYQGSGYGTA